MAYIGNAKTPLIFASNTRDDILPELQQNGQWKSEFLLSQEVPGGYESNIMVLARRVLSDVLVTNSTDLAIEKIEDVNEVSGYRTLLTTSDPNLAAALNILLPPVSFYEGDVVSITSTVQDNNNKKARVLSKTYSGDELSVTLDNPDLVAETGLSITITRIYYAPWEVLEPEKDYAIVNGNTEAESNRIIDFTTAPKEGDVVYVLHKGDATYNFVPSPKSVGPDQLQENLRDFICDRYSVEDVSGQSEFDLSREAINSKSLFVTVDGQITDGDDPDSAYTGGDWTLSQDRQSITFKQALAQNTNVKILHLGFSTVSRKSNISAGQVTIPDRSIKTIHLDFSSVISNRIANGAVTTPKLADGSVVGAKILLNNAETLNTKNSSGTTRGILGLTSQNTLEIKNVDDGVTISGATGVTLKTGVSETSTLTAVNSMVGIGTTTPTEMLHISGTAPSILLTDTDTGADSLISASSTSGSLVISADQNNESANTTLTLRVDGADAITVAASGNVGIGVTAPTQKLDVLGTVKSTNVETQTINGISVDNIGVPSGAIIMHGADAAPTGWLLCDGNQYSGTDPIYQKLFQAIGQRYGGTGTSFRVPDMRKRFPIGQSSDLSAGLSDGLVVENRSIEHSHTGAEHTHNISHTHTIPGHTHSITANSTLAILSETSGGHTTSISHTHTGLATNPTNLSHHHEFTHGHAGPFNTADGGVDHYHTGSTSSDGEHTHELSSNNTGTNVTDGTSTRAYSSDNTSFSRTRNTGSGGQHSHTFTTGGATSVLHKHSFGFSDATTRVTGGATNSNASAAVSMDHSHSIPNITLSNTNSSSTGHHKHNATDFSGSVGNAALTKTTTLPAIQGATTLSLSNVTNLSVGSVVTSSQFTPGTTIVAISGTIVTTSSGALSAITTGSSIIFSAPDGNNNINTISQNNANSGPATYTGNTGTSVSPYMVVNFIIKL